MKHRTEEELIGYRGGEAKERVAIAAHLKECAECRAELARIEAVFGALDAMPIPDPGEDYGERVWQRIAPRLGEKKVRWWESLFVPQRLAALGGVVALVILAFVAGRLTRRPVPLGDQADAAKVRERVLVVAVGEHLGRTEMVLMELENAPTQKGQKAINISETQRRAEDLVEENRLYRQTKLEARRGTKYEHGENFCTRRNDLLHGGDAELCNAFWRGWRTSKRRQGPGV